MNISDHVNRKGRPDYLRRICYRDVSLQDSSKRNIYFLDIGLSLKEIYIPMVINWAAGMEQLVNSTSDKGVADRAIARAQGALKCTLVETLGFSMQDLRYDGQKKLSDMQDIVG